MNILIAGASGMIGQALVEALQTEHALSVLGRDKNKLQALFSNLQAFTWDKLTAKDLKNFAVVINLAGENVGEKRWSLAQKKRILQSRVQTTEQLTGLCIELGADAPRLISASAIGIYGLQKTIKQQKETIYTEQSALPDRPEDFLSQVGQAWEAPLHKAKQAGVSVTVLRFSVVLSKRGGALAKLLPSFKCGLGARLGSGEQPFSWVALSDVVAAIKFLLQQPEAAGVFNVVAPQVVSQHEFAKVLAKVLQRPYFLVMPKSVVKLLFGQMGDELLLNGQHVTGHALRDLGFVYEYGSLKDVLKK